MSLFAKTVSVTLLAGLFASSAFASTIALGTVLLGGTRVINAMVIMAPPQLPVPTMGTVFTNTYNFSLAANGLLDISVFNTGKIFSDDPGFTYLAFSPFEVKLDGNLLAYSIYLDPTLFPTSDPSVTYQNSTQTYSFGPALSFAGAHVLTVAGTTDPYNDTTYAGNLSLSALPMAVPVPEPESFGLVLAALGALGLLTRRRQT